MLLRNFRRFEVISVGLSLLLLIAWAIFVYQVSPLRDPSFQYNGDARSLVPWLSGVTEDHWLWSANILAVLLSTNITFIFARQIRHNAATWLIGFIATIGIWVIMFISFWFAFMFYLLNQWLVD